MQKQNKAHNRVHVSLKETEIFGFPKYWSAHMTLLAVYSSHFVKKISSYWTLNHVTIVLFSIISRLKSSLEEYSFRQSSEGGILLNYTKTILKKFVHSLASLRMAGAIKFYLWIQK